MQGERRRLRGCDGGRRDREQPGGIDVMLVEVGGLVKGPTTLAGPRLRWYRPSGSEPAEVELPRRAAYLNNHCSGPAPPAAEFGR